LVNPESNDPYNFEGPVPSQLPKGNFMPYHSILDDLEDWPTDDAFNDFNSFSEDPDTLVDLPHGTLDEPQSSTQTAKGHRTRSGRISKITPWIADHFIGLMDLPSKPATFEEAAKEVGWQDAMEQEIASCQKNKVWQPCMLLEGKVPILTKWIFKVKQKADGSL
jgi:hypothetical protein